jgi:hypothetical protein
LIAFGDDFEGLSQLLASPDAAENPLLKKSGTGTPFVYKLSN